MARAVHRSGRGLDRMGAGACRVGPALQWTAANAGQAQLAADVATPAIVALGQTLFFDARLSRRGRVSCASCHAPERAFTDGRPLAVGEDGSGRRRSTPLYAAPFAPRLFWDGRAATPGTSDGAAARSARDEPRRGRRGRPARRIRVLSRPVPARIWRSARTGFASRRRPHVVRAKPPLDAISVAPVPGSPIDADRLARALAAHVATSLRPERTRFDDFIEGRADALDDTELLGLHLFRTRPLHELPRRPAAERSRLPQHRAVFLRPAQPGSGAL